MKVSTFVGRCLFCAGLCLAAGGCVTRYTSVINPPRAEVTFQSAAGATMFYEAYLSRYYSRSTRPSINIGLEFPLPYSYSQVKTDNAFFDEAVAAADTNHDGVISDAEARAYSALVRVRAPKIIPVTVANR